jgi:hypothetical protein
LTLSAGAEIEAAVSADNLHFFDQASGEQIS